jgi:hypothetical protein
LFREQAFFPGRLSFVGEVLPLTAAAPAKNRARRFPPLDSRFKQFQQFRLGMPGIAARDPATHQIAGCRPGDEYCHTGMTAQPATTKREGVDPQINNHVHRQRP